MVRFLDLIAHDRLLACVRSLHCPPLAEWAVTDLLPPFALSTRTTASQQQTFPRVQKRMMIAKLLMLSTAHPDQSAVALQEHLIHSPSEFLQYHLS